MSRQAGLSATAQGLVSRKGATRVFNASTFGRAGRLVGESQPPANGRSEMSAGLIPTDHGSARRVVVT